MDRSLVEKMRRAKSQISDHLYRARGIANYQFNAPIGQKLFPDSCIVELSKSSGRIRHILYDSKMLATIRASDGRLVLTIWGAQRLHQILSFPKFRVVVHKEIASFIAEGRSVFAKHVLNVDLQLRAGDEVLIVDEKDKLLAEEFNYPYSTFYDDSFIKKAVKRT